MKKIVSENTFSDLLNHIPERQITKTNSPYALYSLDTNNSYVVQKETPLLTEVKNDISRYYDRSNDENPHFRYVMHQKMDGVITSKMLYQNLKDENNLTTIYNPQINEKNIANHINNRVLKRTAIDYDLVEKEKISLLNIISTLITVAIPTILAYIAFFEDHINFPGSLKAFNHIGIPVYIISLLIVVGFAVWAYISGKNRTKSMLEKIQVKINEMDDEEFCDFIDNFSPEDFLIPDCDKVPLSQRQIYICALDGYNLRQLYILKNYQLATNSKQLWWIFAKRQKSNEEWLYIISDYEKEDISISYYNLVPLNGSEKRRLAALVYKEQSKLYHKTDAGLKHLGVDYIFSHIVNKKTKQTIDTKQLDEKITYFCRRQHDSGYNADIKMIIRLVASLCCNYKIDFYNKRMWQHIFDYSTGASELIELDKLLSDELKTDNGTIKILVPEIVHEFEDLFEEILLAYPIETLEALEQWCIVKALRACRPESDEQFVAVADALNSKFEEYNSNEFKTDIWTKIIVNTADAFYANEEFWFLPTLLNRLLLYYTNTETSGTVKIFSKNIILKIAKANVLLNFDTSPEDDDILSNDAIRTHYEICVNAIKETNRDFDFDKPGNVPSAFGILQLTNKERLQYFNCLIYLNEKDVLTYFGYMFDLYCTNLLLMPDTEIKFCIKELYTDSLYNKYANSTGKYKQKSDYTGVIITKILELLQNLYGDKFTIISNGISDIRYLTQNKNDKNFARFALFIIAKFEISNLSTLSFIMCLTVRKLYKNTISKDIYLNMGNYLLRLIFLTYHENSQNNFFNDDFIHLVNICANYQEPGETIIGYANCCSVFPKPQNAANLINDFTRKHKQAYMSQLFDVAKQISVADADSFITFIFCNKIFENDEDIPIYAAVASVAEQKFKTSPKYPALAELLSLMLHNCSSAGFLEDSFENITKNISQLQKDAIYLIFVKYVKLYPEKSFRLFAEFSQVILKCNMSMKLSLFSEYLIKNDDNESQQYIKVAKIMYEGLLSSNLLSIMLIDEMILVNSAFGIKKSANPELYEWLTSDIQVEAKNKLIAQKSELIIIQAREFLNMRRLDKYGIILFLRFYLINGLKKVADKEYSKKTDEEKSEYFISNFQTINPIIETSPSNIYNEIYIDLLLGYINNAYNIQNRIDQKTFLKKVANDTLYVVENDKNINQNEKTEIYKMVNGYLTFLSRNPN